MRNFSCCVDIPGNQRQVSVSSLPRNTALLAVMMNPDPFLVLPVRSSGGSLKSLQGVWEFQGFSSSSYPQGRQFRAHPVWIHCLGRMCFTVGGSEHKAALNTLMAITEQVLELGWCSVSSNAGLFASLHKETALRNSKHFQRKLKFTATIFQRQKLRPRELWLPPPHLVRW